MSLSRMVKDISKELQLINVDGLRSNFYDIVAKSKETQTSLAAAGAGQAESGAGEDGARAHQAARRRTWINTQ